jgi:hypothetical protein
MTAALAEVGWVLVATAIYAALLLALAYALDGPR